ncbi:transcriptional regulator [Pelomonas sp. V22]|uniref:helix-turn-helix transcriptional regulator n=1 Tax=Pelomonas sp. V22 TaxID=2822139 RepID=UPI0024A969B3|nr:metalloregulator ArsR/SmtB family transcription factor [Pelomonas sp. V22]MDI4633596.1 transcriptional regulator [Pelomonas sp. V22]
MRQTTEQLLYQLKSRGPQSAATLAAACAITPMGAHKQLQSLQEQGLVDAEDQVQGPGRPKRIWRLSAAGHARFPDRHGDLAVQLIRQTVEVLGDQALERLIAAREQQMLASYAERLQGARSLQARVQRLAELRGEEGYLARVEKQGRAWLLIEDHCPICAAATACQGFCRSELQLFRQLLGEAVQVERSEHLLAGARRCAYRISPA